MCIYITDDALHTLLLQAAGPPAWLNYFFKTTSLLVQCFVYAFRFLCCYHFTSLTVHCIGLTSYRVTTLSRPQSRKSIPKNHRHPGRAGCPWNQCLVSVTPVLGLTLYTVTTFQTTLNSGLFPDFTKGDSNNAFDERFNDNITYPTGCFIHEQKNTSCASMVYFARLLAKKNL